MALFYMKDTQHTCAIGSVMHTERNDGIKEVFTSLLHIGDTSEPYITCLCPTYQMADTAGLRGQFLKLNEEQTILNLCGFTFNQRVVEMRNALPAGVATASVVSTFKFQLKAHLKPPSPGKNTHRSHVGIL